MRPWYHSIISLTCTHSYALPTKSTEVMIMQEQGTKMYVDAVLKTHERVVQVKFSLLVSVSFRFNLILSLLVFWGRRLLIELMNVF